MVSSRCFLSTLFAILEYGLLNRVVSHFVLINSLVVVGALQGYKSPYLPSMQCKIPLCFGRSRQQALCVSSKESSSLAPAGVIGQFQKVMRSFSSYRCNINPTSMNSINADRGSVPASCCAQAGRSGKCAADSVILLRRQSQKTSVDAQSHTICS